MLISRAFRYAALPFVRLAQILDSYAFGFTVIESKVPSHEGPAAFVWKNTNVVDRFISGGVSGHFRNVVPVIPGALYRMTGEEFHGIVELGDDRIFPTLYLYGYRYSYPEDYTGPRVYRDKKGRLQIALSRDSADYPRKPDPDTFRRLHGLPTADEVKEACRQNGGFIPERITSLFREHVVRLQRSF